MNDSTERTVRDLALENPAAPRLFRLSRGTADNPWISAYKWPIYFFVAVAFWNFVGAGLFGFMINPPPHEEELVHQGD
jgi:hypothetical protein